MNREILKAKIAEVISSTNKSGNEKLEAILAVVDAYSSADNGAKPIVSGSLPSDDRIVTEAIQAARKMDTEVGLLPSNNDIKMFCLGAKWMRDWVQSNDRLR